MHPLARWKLRGVKPYIPGKPIEELARELNLKGEIYKLASNENPLGPSPMAVKAMEDALGEMNLYPDDMSYYLVKKLSEKIGVSPAEIILGNGSVEIMLMIALSFVNPGESIVASDQSFIMYRIVGNIIGAVMIEPPLKDGRIDLEAILLSIRPDTKVIFISNPNNPTGTALFKEEVENFMKKVPEDVIVVWDEAYYEYMQAKNFKETVSYVKRGWNCVILRTFSKIYGLAGLRLGYGIAPKEIIDTLMRVRLPFNINRMAQIAAYHALDDEEHVRKSVELVETEKKYLYHEFTKLGLKYLPTYTNFIFVDLGRDAAPAYEYLLKKGVIVRPLKNYNFPNALRITIGTHQQNVKLIELLNKFLKNTESGH